MYMKPSLSKPMDERLQKDIRTMHTDVWEDPGRNPYLISSNEIDHSNIGTMHTLHKEYAFSLNEATVPKPFREEMQKDIRNMNVYSRADPRRDTQLIFSKRDGHFEAQENLRTYPYPKTSFTPQPPDFHRSIATEFSAPPVSGGNQLSFINGHILRDSSMGIMDIQNPLFLEKQYSSHNFVQGYPPLHRVETIKGNTHANEVDMKTVSNNQSFPFLKNRTVIDNHFLQSGAENYRSNIAGIPQPATGPQTWGDMQGITGMGPGLGGFSFQRLISGDITGMEHELEEDSDDDYKVGEYDEMDQNEGHINEQVDNKEHDRDMYSTMFTSSFQAPNGYHRADFSGKFVECSNENVDYNGGEINQKDDQGEHDIDMYTSQCTSSSMAVNMQNTQVVTYQSESQESYDMYKGQKGISKFSNSEWTPDIHKDRHSGFFKKFPDNKCEGFHGNSSMQWEGQGQPQTSSDSSRDLYTVGIDSVRKKNTHPGSPCMHPVGNSSCPASPDYVTMRCTFDNKQLADCGSPCLHPVVDSQRRAPSTEEPITPPDQSISKTSTLTEVPTTTKALLLSGVLEGCHVSYKDKGGGVKLTGTVKNGGILCNCDRCKGESVVNVTLFERHAGSTARHPSDNIFLDNGMSLSEMLRGGMQTEVKSSRKAAKDENARKNQCISTGTNKFRSDVHFSKVLRVSSPSQIGLDQMSISQRSSRHFLQLDEMDSARKNQFTSSGLPLPPVTSKRLSDAQLLKAAPTPSASQTREISLHKMLFLPGGLADGTEVAYYFKGQRILTGRKEGPGICCSCCHEVISCSSFEAHAGWGSRRNPYSSIYLSDGQSLHMFAQSLAVKKQEEACDKIARENDDDCAECGDGGDLVLCDACPRAYHIECIGLTSIPEGDWYCPTCEAKGGDAKQKCTKSFSHLFGASNDEKHSDRCQRVVKVSKNALGGCVICKNGDFLKTGFGEKTVLLCDQCEREYHVGCMKEKGIADLKELPPGEWFCGLDCTRIHKTLQALVLNGPQPVHPGIIDMLKRNRDQEGKGMLKLLHSEFSWQLLHGRRGDPENGRILSKAATILLESFAPIIDAASGRDLISLMVHSRSIRDQDFRGVYCAVLKWKGEVVSTAIIRIFGRHFAELPLVATNTSNRGQGFFQMLMLNIENLLAILQVEHLLLPAAEEAESIWTNKFGFSKINSEEQLQQFASQVQIMTFQGSSMLLKSIRPHHFLSFGIRSGAPKAIGCFDAQLE